MTIKVVKMSIGAVMGNYYLALLSKIGGDDDLDQRFSTCESQLPRGSKDLFIGATSKTIFSPSTVQKLDCAPTNMCRLRVILSAWRQVHSFSQQTYEQGLFYKHANRASIDLGLKLKPIQSQGQCPLP